MTRKLESDVVRIATCQYVQRDGWWVWIGIVVNEHGAVLWESDNRRMTEAEAVKDAEKPAFALTYAEPWYRMQQCLRFTT